ncbi:hypothetical protein Tcan_04396 [Toxocara canis]|uniref:Uncharacterized protein n=1 Tax=Toxocara canis TaxID=6265 RepID=A0A0B2UY25_TOXCA|nr:hypothetical protein Tcan_04396 [Toxocara canis]
MSSKRAAKRSWDIDSGSWDIDTPIGVNFSPGSKRLSVRVIQKYLRNGFLEQRVHHHGNCGRIVCKEKQTGRLRLPPIDCLPRLELIGHPISKEETTVSPITDRRNKLARVVECHAPNAPKLKTDIHVVSSPSSREQADHMKMRLLMDSRYFGNEQASEAIEEIGTLWDVWNEDAALCCQIIDEIPKHVHQLFLTSCAKLHNKSQTEQMTVISEVIDVDLRQMKSTVNALHEALFAVIEYRALNG